MSRTNVSAARAEKELPASLQHVDAHVVDERSRDLLCPAHADVVAGVRTRAARSVRDEQVVPAVAKDHDRRFAVDRDVDWLPLGVEPFAGPRIQLDESDVAEVRAVCEPERPVGGIAKHARVDGVAVLDAIGPYDRTA